MFRVFVFESWWLSGDKKGKGGVERGSRSSCKGVFSRMEMVLEENVVLVLYLSVVWE